MKLKLSNKQINKIAKQIKGYTPDEFDQILDMDEAHQEFMRGEGKILGQQEVEDITANVVNYVLDEIHQYSGEAEDVFYSNIEKTDKGMEFTEKLFTAISSVVSSYTG